MKRPILVQCAYEICAPDKPPHKCQAPSNMLHFIRKGKGTFNGVTLSAGQGFLAILCGLRRPDLHLEGLELQPEACALAQANARRAGLELPVTAGDLRQLPGALHGR